MEMTVDVLIIGAGAVGCAVARELSRYRLRVAVVERHADVAGETSGRNSAVVHAGFNNRPGSLMAKLCVEGSQNFEALCAELDVPCRRTGKYLVAFDGRDEKILRGLIEKGQENGCRGLRMVKEAELRQVLPHVGGISAMYSPETAVFDPFLYTVALAENAHDNGASFFLSHRVTAIEKTADGFRITAGRRLFHTRCLVNCAGLYAAAVSDMAGVPGYRIYPCRGEYYVMDTAAAEYLPAPVYPAPRPGIGGLGVHLTPTIHGGIIIGPSAEYLDDAGDYATTAPVLDRLWYEARQPVPRLPRGAIIGSFAGIRPKTAPPSEGGYHDFIIKEEPSRPGLINLIGIESPGLTASVPIGRMVCNIAARFLPMEPRSDFKGRREGILRFREQSEAQQAELIAQNANYGEIICRCQMITKWEILAAIENPLGVHTLSGIKYRAWSMTGRCQGGYCLPRIAEILRREYGIEPEDMRCRDEGSYLFTGKVNP